MTIDSDPTPDTDVDEFLRRFAIRIRLLRIDAGWSQEQLARAAGIHRTTISDIERARRHVGIGTLPGLAAALGVSIPALFRADALVDLAVTGTAAAS